MVQVTLRAMTPPEYDEWRPAAIAAYSDDHIRAGSMPADSAHEMAEKQFTDLLPDGVSTREHHLLVPEVDDSAAGILWLHIPVDAPAPAAFIYDILVHDHLRGRGIGRGIMLAAEDYARAQGAVSMRLHVFGDNTVARHLYESLGYDVTNVQMSKPLDIAPG